MEDEWWCEGTLPLELLALVGDETWELLILEVMPVLLLFIEEVFTCTA